MRFIACDTETVLIADRDCIKSSSGRTIYTSPFEIPALVCLSTAGEEDGGPPRLSNDPKTLAPYLASPTVSLVFHNLVFDYQVLTSAGLDRRLFDAAAEEGRLHDTMLLDVLYGLAVGRYDKPKYNKGTRKWAQEEVKNRALETLAWEYCGIKLEKDPTIRLGYGQFLNRPLADLPSNFRDYALADAEATLSVFNALRDRLEQIGARNYLSEAVQLRAALALSDLDRRGICVDKEEAETLYHLFLKQMVPLQAELVSAGLGRWRPERGSRHVYPAVVPERDLPEIVSLNWSLQPNGTIARIKKYKKGIKVETARPAFSIITKEIQRTLEPYHDEKTPTREDGSISLEADYWIEQLLDVPGPLGSWLRLGKLGKVLQTYLAVYRRCFRVYPRWYILGARSGRMSAAAPSIQNVPKRKSGIRSLFIPSPGHVFIKADYSAQELYTLAEFMAFREIRGPLLKILRSGQDVHTAGAALILGKRPEDVTPLERQGQKVLHFGVPGGLGPTKLAAYAYGMYGVVWDVKTAKRKREEFLEVYSDIDSYLTLYKKGQDWALRKATGAGRKEWAQVVGTDGWDVIRQMQASANVEYQSAAMDAEHIVVVELPSGRRRSRCRFTEAANTGFQGLAADVTKAALWRCRRAGLCVVLVVHDEIVVECPREGDIGGTKSTLERCMLEAFAEICPEIGPYARVELQGPLDRWGPATDIYGETLDTRRKDG